MGDLPVLSVLGRVTQMSDAEAAIDAGLCDLVGSVRELIAEPRFVSNARAGTEEQVTHLYRLQLVPERFELPRHGLRDQSGLISGAQLG